MTDRTPRDILPFMTPQWLLDATKKPPRPPSQALLDRMRYAREHPDELAKELRESSARAGRDADALFKTMAKMRQNVHRARLAQRSKNIHSSIEAQDLVVADESVDTVGAETGIARVAAFRPAAVVPSTSSVPRGLSAEAQAMVVSEDTPRLASPSASVQRRMGTRGQITKPTRSQSRSERDLSSDKARRKPPNSGTTSGATSSASGTASPIVVGSTQTPSSSSVAGAVIKALNATSDSLDNQSPAITQPILQSYPFPIRSAMPNWYASVSQQSQMRLERRRPQEIAAIDALKACISRCEQGQHLDKLDKEYNDLRDHVHKAETKLVMDKAKAKKTRILLQNGLPRIFDEHAKFPWDLKADSWHLYEKWMNGDFDNDILRGIITVKGKDRNGDRLDPTYRKEHPKDTKIFGNNGAILGQWWPSQLCAVRDGVHGAAQGGKLYLACLTGVCSVSYRYLRRQRRWNLQYCALQRRIS